ncbi:hypothetical protein [Saccharopolyspora phatthalungensis]|uniref:Uncharacterized protein n=1 Tax=Saccharopolyspora phatthalungensis TaxID=664693 RepID=A0A840Q509_9PSEU|nr:hypothetical protein [Saccharopolyspora phatthalungensis]MBB5153818.1 hypothetical protein [Saccharopolyspora phatthalungensis]
MDISQFDDQLVCDRQDHPTFLVELWSGHYDEHGEPQGWVVSHHILNGCDVREALAWAQEQESDPGGFVLFAGTWTNRGFLKTLWLAGQAPGYGARSATVTFETSSG